MHFHSMRKNLHGKILKWESKEHHLSTIPKSCSLSKPCFYHYMSDALCIHIFLWFPLRVISSINSSATRSFKQYLEIVTSPICDSITACCPHLILLSHIISPTESKSILYRPKFLINSIQKDQRPRLKEHPHKEL